MLRGQPPSTHLHRGPSPSRLPEASVAEQSSLRFLTLHFSPLSQRPAEEPSAAPEPPPRGKAPQVPGKPSLPGLVEAPTEASHPKPTPLPRPSAPSLPEDSGRRLPIGQQPVLHQRPLQPLPPPAWPRWSGVPFLPGSTGVIMETGEAGPPGRMGVSGRGLPQGVDGQTGQEPIPSVEGFAGAPGKAPPGQR